MEKLAFPFKILVLAPFLPEEENVYAPEPWQIDSENFDSILPEANLSFYVSLPKDLHPSGGVNITINKIKDFHPDSLIKSTPFLRNLWEVREFIKEAKAKGISEEEVSSKLANWPDLPPELRFTPSSSSQPKEKEKASTLDDLLRMVALPEENKAPSLAYPSLISALQWRLKQTLKLIYKDETLRRLESTWRGLKYLWESSRQNHNLSIMISPISGKNLNASLDKLLPILILDLPSLILLDLPFDNSNPSIENLQKIASFAEMLLVPVVCWIKPKFFYLESWRELSQLPYLPHYLEESVYAKWRQLQKSAAARWLVVTCNQFLGRYPYGPENKPAEVDFEERDNLWISPVWALGSLISQSLQKYGWPTRFTEWTAFRLNNLPLSPPESGKSYPTEVLWPEERIEQFIKAGLVPLVSMANKDIIFFPRETTVAGGSLSYQLFLSRVTQFLLWYKETLGFTKFVTH